MIHPSEYGLLVILVTCSQAKATNGYACQSNHKCVSSTREIGGYCCVCKDGYEGNPYLSPGCKDINECQIQEPTLVTVIALILKGVTARHVFKVLVAMQKHKMVAAKHARWKIFIIGILALSCKYEHVFVHNYSL